MKQTVLPGIDLSRRRPDPEEDAQWPSTAELLTALAECDLPATVPPPIPERDEERALFPLTILGMGLSSTLLPAHREVLESSTVLAAGQALLARFAHMEAEKVPLRSPLQNAVELLLERRRNGARVTVLADGDPLFFGIGATLARRLSPEVLRILPGLSSLQEACARACLPWHDVRCVSLHGRGKYTELSVAALSGKPICLLTDDAATPDAIARFLLDRGVDWYSMHVFENMHHEQESSCVCSLPEATQRCFGTVCTVLLIPGAPRRSPYLGISDTQLASEGGQFTKAPVRAAALAALRIRPADLVWDLGAGPGAVALEACALAYGGLVFAVERDAARVLCIEENRRRFGAANLEIIAGNAPDCLRALPDPDTVFIGGGFGKPESAHSLVDVVCSRLKPGGRLAISCVLMGSLERCRALLHALGWETRIRCIQVSETSSLGNDERLTALNPVFLISAVKHVEDER